MRLTPPKKATWWISLILGVLGLVLTLVISLTRGEFSVYGLWLVVLAWLLLSLGIALKGL